MPPAAITGIFIASAIMGIIEKVPIIFSGTVPPSSKPVATKTSAPNSSDLMAFSIVGVSGLNIILILFSLSLLKIV
ncbi:Uncharacterised protein [Staphylococcus aureus]|nr:Uncharacterised protein [Staphylococcus aureus]